MSFIIVKGLAADDQMNVYWGKLGCPSEQVPISIPSEKNRSNLHALTNGQRGHGSGDAVHQACVIS